MVFIEKIFEDVTRANAEDPRSPPMTYKDIRSHIESVLDANDVPIATPRMGILMAESDKSLLLESAADKPKKEDRDRGRGRGDRGRGDRGGRGRGSGVGRGNQGAAAQDKLADRPGRFPGDLSLMKSKAGAEICAAFQKGRCDKEVSNGGCSTGGGLRLHICAVILKTKPWELCEGNHSARECSCKV